MAIQVQHCTRLHPLHRVTTRFRRIVKSRQSRTKLKTVAAQSTSRLIIKHVHRGAQDRVVNFSAGPACLPIEVLEVAQREMLNYPGGGMSVLEMSHRGAVFDNIAKRAEADLRQLLDIPEDYAVLFLQGGASTQFSAVPLNLSQSGDVTDHVVTGSWSKKAATEAKKYSHVNIAAEGDMAHIPDVASWKLDPNAAYLHYCDNETIQGVEFQSIPDVQNAILVSDMSSSFCSKAIDVRRFGVIYAGAQKNIGGAGVTVVIVRKDLIGKARPETPVMLNYETMAETGSMYNTPPCYAIYICGLVFQHLLRKGGLKAVQAMNQEKAKLLYDCIEASEGYYVSPVDPSVRSVMNVPFVIPRNPELEKIFVKEAKIMGLVELKGHRSVGGMRASIYNSMPIEGIESLVQFMKDFSIKFKE